MTPPPFTPEQAKLIAEHRDRSLAHPRTLSPGYYDKPGDPLHGAPLTRRASGLLEAQCEHGCGHPIDESVEWLDAFGPPGARGTWGVHCCDRCCRPNGPRQIYEKAQLLVHECRWSAARAELADGPDWLPTDG